MIRILTAALLSCSLIYAQDELIPVESVPAETSYGSSLTKRPSEIWLEALKGAKKSIDIEQFYIESEKGESLEPIIKEIRSRARAGVKVRAIFDKAMLKSSGKYLFLFKEKNMSYRIIDFKKVGGGVQHSKFFIIDGGQVYIGSQNFDWRSLSHIREFGFLIKSRAAASDFKKIFEADWKNAEKPKKDYFSKGKISISCDKPLKALMLGQEVSYCLAFSPAGGKYQSEIKEMLKIIDSAKESISAQVMTYSDKKNFSQLEQAFLAAAGRNVKVKLVFSDWSLGSGKDSAIRRLAGNENIEVKISSIPVFSGGHIPFARVEHLKYITADDNVFMASTSNWGYDYFYETRGAAVIVRGAAAGLLGKALFEQSWNGPYVFTFDPAVRYEAKKRD